MKRFIIIALLLGIIVIIAGIIGMLITGPAAAQEYDGYSDEYVEQEQVRPLGGNYYDNGGGNGQGWQYYSGGHGCYTSTVNGYSVTSCH